MATDHISAAIDRVGKQFKETADDFSTRISELEKRAARSDGYRGTSGGADFASEIANHRDLANFDPQARKSIRLQFNRGFSGEEFAAITSGTGTVGATTSAGTSLVEAHRVPGIVTPAERQLVLRDLFSVFQTTSGSVEYAKEESYTNNARPVTEGETKPTSDLTFNLHTAKVVTLAHLFKASLQILSDSPALGAYIAQRALRGLKVTEEAQLLAGNGTGQNLNGLIPQASTYSGGATSDTPIDTIRRAINQVRVSEHVANGIVVHPDFLMDVDLTKDAEERYILGSPVNGNQPKLWGLPVIATTAIDSGDFLVGAFGSAAAIADRWEAVVELSTENVDDFSKNMATVRCEERLGLLVFQPDAFVTGSF